MLTIRDPSSVGAMAIGVSYDAFVDDVEVRNTSAKARVGCYYCKRSCVRLVQESANSLQGCREDNLVWGCRAD